MNIKFNLIFSTILLVPYAGVVRADAALETLDSSGTKCTTKLSLCELDASKVTSLGLKGDKGERGDVGPKGEPGICTCDDGESDDLDSPFGDEGGFGDTDETAPKKDPPGWGTIEKPGRTTCKNAPIDKSGTYYVYNAMEVVCDVDTKTTCVVIHAKPSDVTFSDPIPSWLSSAGIEYRDIYNLTNTQFAWLKARSDTASIKIRYHCVNTKPADKDRPVLLLSWNEAIIKNEATPSSPISYEVGYDGCATAAEGMWGHTDIAIKNISAHRLPIIDFYFQDNTKDAIHKISVTELCFH